MCFSATASFGAGVALTVIGVASLKKVQHPSQILFAAIPLIFAVQQIAEGVLWLILPHPALLHLQKYITYFFLVFAQIIWPLWLPVAVLLLEKSKTRRLFQKILIGIGLLVSGYLTYCLIHYPVHADINCYHIAYEQVYPAKLRVMGGLLYIIATIAPPLFSHIRRMWILSLTVFISYIITTVFYDNYVVSVWCFFASVVSLSVYFIMREVSEIDKAFYKSYVRDK
ncbi:hypothetical protein BDD43_4969 [Mucilaginibacter gracilis]|uniref:Uncharacterized protein n=1 Tax=Mucilaginibacter gracilis TaxID=423350 RepID=A0A495J8E0_9SPHI|nr:DUF6629 family protein [Mucilaginibacter gracilis]RKR84718.1 hypothetical protein BDD43_4969 [Mucilaginibacter gracilis]